MTKKHYEAIASVVKHCYHDAILAYGEYFRVEDVAKRLADYFATDNPKFDRARFLASCGIGEIPESDIRHR